MRKWPQKYLIQYCLDQQDKLLMPNYCHVCNNLDFSKANNSVKYIKMYLKPLLCAFVNPFNDGKWKDIFKY